MEFHFGRNESQSRSGMKVVIVHMSFHFGRNEKYIHFGVAIVKWSVTKRAFQAFFQNGTYKQQYKQVYCFVDQLCYFSFRYYSYGYNIGVASFIKFKS